MAREQNQKRGLLWAWLGGAVLVVGVIAIAISAIIQQQQPAPPTGAPTAEPSESPSAVPPSEPGSVVDPSAADHGWVPEPITTDADLYMARALEAAATFDTQLSSRNEWLAYLETWFTLDTRYTSASDREDALESATLELRQSVVPPEAEWDSLANEKGRVTATTLGPIGLTPVSDDTSGDMHIGTADVTLEYVRVDGDGAEYGYEEQVRVSVQVLCGDGSIPTPDSAQRPGDCKIVRYFPEPMEP